MQEILFKSTIYNRNSYVYIWYFVASCACEVTVKESHTVLLCVRISVTSQAQLATMYILLLFLLYITLFENYFYPCVFILFNLSFLLSDEIECTSP